MSFELLHEIAPGPLGGLAWDGSHMLFSDVAGSTIHAFDPATGAVAPWRRYSNRSNGIAFGRDGALFACQEGGRRVVRLLADGSAVPTLSVLNGRQQNHPNAIVVDAAGAAWFSDCFHCLPASGPQIFPLQERQSVLRLSAGWRLERMTQDSDSPRGVAFSPDERTLYVADGGLRAYPVQPDGRLGMYRLLHQASMEGLCADAAGRVFACSGEQVLVIAADGSLLQTHALPAGQQAVQCAFGGADLYVTTAAGQLLRARDIPEGDTP